MDQYFGNEVTDREERKPSDEHRNGTKEAAVKMVKTTKESTSNNSDPTREQESPRKHQGNTKMAVKRTGRVSKVVRR